jgi:pheromone shutdown-related protein TraB
MLEKIKVGDRSFFILGTAHISQKSVDEVAENIEKIKPDTVCVELCQTRYKNINEANRWRELDIVQVIKEKKSGFLFASLLLSSFQRKMGKELNIQVGAEMIQAIKISEEKKIDLCLADREVNITIQRVWRSLNFWQKLKLSSQLFLGLFFSPKIKAEQVEEMKKKDLLSGLIEELAREFPKIKQVLIDERDEYLAGKIFKAQGKKVFAVVGIGHQAGILKKIAAYSQTNLPDFEKLEQIPHKRAIVAKTIQWAIPTIILGIFVYGFLQFDSKVSLKLLWNWFLVNSIPAFLGASIAGASWWTRWTAFFAAPFTSVNPALSAGWVAGLVEAIINKPKVKDFESISDDMLSWKKIRMNLITRILLVVILTNLGSALGTFAGIPLLAYLLK